MEEARKTVAQNRKAHFNYIVTDSIECGIALEGSEVKSIKAGNISFGDSFAFIENGEVKTIFATHGYDELVPGTQYEYICKTHQYAA